MRLYPSILVVSLALLESGSQASKVRSTAAVDPTTQVASVTDKQHGLSLLSTTNGEDRMIKNLANAVKKPDDIVKKDLEKLIPSLGESSSSSRPTISTVRQKLQTLSDEQKIQLGVKFIHDNTLKKLEKYVGMSRRKGGMAEIDAFFSALCKNLGDDVVTKVVMDVEKAGITSRDSMEKLVAAQFRYWQLKKTSYVNAYKSLRKFEGEDELDVKAENFLRNAQKLDEFIKFRNNGEPDDKSLFGILTQGDGIIEFADFISKGKQIALRVGPNPVELEKRYFDVLRNERTTVVDLFVSLKVKDDGIQMFSGPKFDLMKGYAKYRKPKEELKHLGVNFIHMYMDLIGEKDLGYWLARAAAGGDVDSMNNAKYMANLLFKVIESDQRFGRMIKKIESMVDGGEDAAKFLNEYRLAYEHNMEKNLEGLNDPFGRK